MSDGITFTNNIMDWKYFSYPVTFQTLAFLALTAASSSDGAAIVSVREMAKRLHGVTHKEIRIAIEHLQKESIISTEKHGRYTIVHFLQWHGLSKSILPYTAQSEAQSGAQSQVLQMLGNTDSLKPQQEQKGTIEGTIEGTIKNGAQLRAQLRAQSQSLETPVNTVVLESSENEKGTIEGTIEGTLVGKRNKKEKSTPPTPPTKKETNKEKGRKKIKTDAAFFEDLKERFNTLFRGTKIPECTRMTDDRKLLVKHFIDDYSIETIEVLLQKVAASTDLMNPKRKGNTPFNWIFTPKNYTDIMEGSYDDFVPQQKEETVQPQQQQPKRSWVEAEEYHQSAQERWQEEHDRLQNIANASMQNPVGSCHKMALVYYESGRFQEYGIKYTPPDGKPQQPTASAADIINSDPEGYLASILKQ